MAGPTITSVLAHSTKALRVTWSAAVKQVDPAAADDALNPANYVLAPVTIPAVTPKVTRVTTVSGMVVDLELDIDATPGATYTLTPARVVPAGGGDPTPGAAVELTAYRPPRPAGRQFDLWLQLPAINRRMDETGDLRRFMACLQDVVDLLLADIDRWPEIIDYDLAPDRFVDAILDGLGNPFRLVLEPIDKRRLASVLVPIYTQKGTDPGIINAVRFFVGVEVTIRCVHRDEVWMLEEPSRGVIGGEGDVAQVVTFDPATGRVLLADCTVDPDDPIVFTTTGHLPATMAVGGTYYAFQPDGAGFKLVLHPGATAPLTFPSGGDGVHSMFNLFEGNAMVGPGAGQSAWVFGFEVVSSAVLTDEQRQRIVAVTTYMKPGHARFLGLVEP